MSDIHFGTDGWRGVIGDDFTFENLRRVARATARYFMQERENDPHMRSRTKIIIGYDNRFQSEQFAWESARVCAMNNVDVLVSKTAVPTPAVSYAVVKHRALGGIMITASHNPYYFNGFKVKLHFGASAPSAVTKKIESLLHEQYHGNVSNGAKRIKTESFLESYEERIKKMVDLQKIRRMKISAVIDSMHGSAAGILERIIFSSSLRITGIRNNRDPLFGGVNPEPIDKNLSVLMQEVRMRKGSLGIAFDGDGDRIGLIDEDGSYVNSHKIISLLLWHLAEDKKKKGLVVKTTAGTYMLNRLSSRFNLPLVETHIGFKNITEQMLADNVLIGGEESGGIGFAGHIPERDAVLSALLILEMMAVRKKNLKSLVQDLFCLTGPSFYDRIDIRLNDTANIAGIYAGIKKKYRVIFQEKPCEIKDEDGIKFIWKDDSWLLMRMSGTEPVLRLYAESENMKKTQKLLALGKQFQYNH